jgi:hypothetical protein
VTIVIGVPPSVVQIGGVEDPDIGAADTRSRELRIARIVLPAMGGGDEGAGAARQRPDHARRCRADIHDADAVREVIDHPDFAVAPRGDSNRFEADHDRGRWREAGTVDGEHLEAVVRRVDCEQPAPVRGQCQRPDLTAFERHECRARGEHVRQQHGK